MAAFYHATTITTDASGDATVYSGIVNGRILGIKYLPGASGLDTGADVTITTETTAQDVLVLSNAGTSTIWRYPVQLRHKAADGTDASSPEYVFAVNERIKVVVAQGGNAKTGSIGFLVEAYPLA